MKQFSKCGITISILFVIMVCLTMSCRKLYHRDVNATLYYSYKGESNQIDFLGPAFLFDQSADYDMQAFFYIGDDSTIDSVNDSLARFYMRLTAQTSSVHAHMDFRLISDTSFFREGKSYFLVQCDSDTQNSVNHNNEGILITTPLIIELPYVDNYDNFVKGLSWGQFKRGSGSVCFTLSFNYVLAGQGNMTTDTASLSGYVDVYWRALWAGDREHVLIKASEDE